MLDEQIIELYWNRDEQAIAQTSLKYGRYCHQIAWNVLRSLQDSEECVNDTWLRTWNAIPPQRPSVFRAFLGKITRNLALNRYEASHTLKRGTGETALCLEELSECLPAEGQPEERVESMALTECLNRFLGELKREDRILFVRRYWYMDSVAELAERYSLGESKVKMTLLRLRKRLKERLEKEGITV